MADSGSFEVFETADRVHVAFSLACFCAGGGGHVDGPVRTLHATYICKLGVCRSPTVAASAARSGETPVAEVSVRHFGSLFFVDAKL